MLYNKIYHVYFVNVTLAEIPMGEFLRYRLNSLLRELNFLEEEKTQLEAMIKNALIPTHDVLQTVPGIGPTISAAFRA
jgi:hypothetical protein